MATTNTARIANDSPFCEAHAAMDKIIERLMAMAGEGATADEVTKVLATDGTALLRELMQGYVDRCAERERRVEVIGTDGIERREVRSSSRRVETPVGEIEVKRLLYQAPGVDGIAPLDAALGLPDEKYTHELRRIVAEESAKSSFDEVVELIEKRTGGSVAKRQVKELTVRAAQDFDAFYATRLCEPEITDDLLVLSFDGKGIAMRHADLREATRKAAEAEPKLHTRLAKGEKPNRKRMAQVATVYSIKRWQRTSQDVLHGLRDDRDEARPRPTNKRVWASAQRSAQGVIDDAFAEAHRRDPDHRRSWVVLVDGQRDQIQRVQRAARKVGAEVTIVLDIVHVLEYLWRAAYAFHQDGTPEAEAWVEHQLVKLLAGRSGGELAKSMRLMAKTHGLDATAAKPVEKAAAYLVKHTRLLHYDRALVDGLPIATGVIEGACRYLVQDRMGRTGARWSLAGAEAVLRLRALRASGDFDAYWQFHLVKEHERTHVSRYADGAIPNPLPPSHPRLRLVK
ncbi:MAG TPA: ISKra4 family transposase [Gemmatimonadaceae bacterium]|nr:ISKra4 family transposase [Gemmatimonadaceae bacterium]